MAMKSLEITKNLFLVQKEVKVADKPKVVEPTNHIWAYDRSGSMCGVLQSLCEDLIKQVKTLPMGSTLSLGWFSSEGGQYNFIVKGYKITDSKDFAVIEQAIRKNSTTIGCTCFSEIIANTDQVIQDLSVYSKNFSFMFFTDGYPCVSNYENEIRKINSAIDTIKGKITSSLLVGYGSYYNKQLMSEMATRIGGGLIHSENLKAFNIALANFLKDSTGVGKKVEVELPKCEKLAVFSLTGKQINLYQEEDQKIAFSPSGNTQDEGEFVYFLAQGKQSDFKDVLNIALTDDNVKGKAKQVEPLVKAAYAAAYVLTQSTKTDKALEVLSVLGDKSMIDSVCNAFTNSDYGKAEDKMREACFEPAKRFPSGRNTKYLPAANAFCLLDVLDLLMNDEKAAFFPYHEEFQYNKIGVGAKLKDENAYPKFEPDRNTACSFGTLTWHGEKLNLSVLARIPGTVKLKGDFAAVKLPEVYNTNVWRNYTLVKDGFLNMKQLPVKLSPTTFDVLIKNGVIRSDDVFVENTVCVLDLSAVPIINRSIADGKTSATALCKQCFEEVKLEAKIKAMKFFKDEIENKGVKTVSLTLTPEQEAFLTTNGVGKNGYAPPTEKVEANDFYYAKEFLIKIKNFSSLPSVKEVQKTVTEGKSLTASKALVKAGIDEVEKAVKPVKDLDKAKLEILESLIKAEKVKLNAVRTDIQRTKFAILLGKRSFDEFKSRDDNKISVDGNEYTIEIREVKVEV